MQMKPYKSFFFIIITLVLLLVTSLIAPEGEVNLAGYKLRIYSLNEFKFQINSKRVMLAKTAQPLVLNQEAILKRDRLVQIDSISAESEKTETEPIPVKIPAKLNMVHSDIEIPVSTENLWAGLSMQFSNNERFEKPLRVLYYGDSQIENDRITSVFRKTLQEKYGGSGRGLIAVDNIYNSANNFVMSSSGNWQTSSVVENRQKQLDLGLLCESFKLKRENPGADSVLSWVKIKSLNKELKDGYSIVSLFYRSSGNSNISVLLNGNDVYSEKLKINRDIEEIRFNLGETPEIVELSFSTDDEITVYGLNLESPTGIMVDNIALRGRSYPEFSRIDTTRLKQMAELINPTMLVMQYGVNIVPNIRADYSYYKDHLTRELSYIRDILPGTPILIISVSDMAHKSGGYLQSYPNIDNVLAAQKEAAFDNGCAFWNLYESMGGEGRMIKWVEQDPPLGNKDYVHYTYLGAE